MNIRRTLVPIVAAGTLAGAVVGSPVVPAAHARHIDVMLLSDTAIFVGGTTEPTPSATFAQTAANLFLKPLGFDAGEDPGVCAVGDGCTDALQVLTTPDIVQQGHSSFVGAAQIVDAVKAQFAAHPGEFGEDNPLWVFGYSQGATAGSIAMAQLAHEGFSPEALHFVFIGDPSDPATGAWPHLGDALQDMFGPSTPEATDLIDRVLDIKLLLGNETPTDAFTTTVYTIPDDAAGDFTSVYDQGGILGAAFGLFYQHVMYMGLTPDDIADHTAVTDGLVTNITLDGDFDEFGAWINAFSHGLLDSGLWESLFNSVVAFFYNIFDAMDDFFTDWMGIDWSDVEQTLDVFFPMD